MNTAPWSGKDVGVRFRASIVRNPDYGPPMDMLTGAQIAEANLTDWRKLGQGLHAATWSATSAPAYGSSPHWARPAMHSATTPA